MRVRFWAKRWLENRYCAHESAPVPTGRSLLSNRSDVDRWLDKFYMRTSTPDRSAVYCPTGQNNVRPGRQRTATDRVCKQRKLACYANSRPTSLSVLPNRSEHVRRIGNTSQTGRKSPLYESDFKNVEVTHTHHPNRSECVSQSDRFGCSPIGRIHHSLTGRTAEDGPSCFCVHRRMHACNDSRCCFNLRFD